MQKTAKIKHESEFLKQEHPVDRFGRLHKHTPDILAYTSDVK
jgi:hypothetical protein